MAQQPRTCPSVLVLTQATQDNVTPNAVPCRATPAEALWRAGRWNTHQADTTGLPVSLTGSRPNRETLGSLARRETAWESEKPAEGPRVLPALQGRSPGSAFRV